MELLGKPGPFDKALQGLEFSDCWALLMTRQPWGVTSEIHFSLLEDTACFTVLERGVHGGFWKKKKQVGVFESGKKVSPPGGSLRNQWWGLGEFLCPHSSLIRCCPGHLQLRFGAKPTDTQISATHWGPGQSPTLSNPENAGKFTDSRK